MPKSRKKRKTTSSGGASISWGGASKPGDRRWIYLIAALAVLAVGYGGYAWWDRASGERSFAAQAAEGEAALARVETFPSEGRTHLAPGEAHHYADAFPTSGPHDPVWTPPGVYGDPQRPTQLVHALEHGNVVIYYDQPGAEAMETLEAWASLYGDQWSGLVVTQASGLGEGIVLTAWTKRLELERFDPAAAAAFVDAYRGRGPEHPVR